MPTQKVGRVVDGPRHIDMNSHEVVVPRLCGPSVLGQFRRRIEETLDGADVVPSHGLAHVLPVLHQFLPKLLQYYRQAAHQSWRTWAVNKEHRPSFLGCAPFSVSSRARVAISWRSAMRSFGLWAADTMWPERANEARRDATRILNRSEANTMLGRSR